MLSGAYEFYPVGHPDLRLEVRNSSARDGAAVQVYYRRGGDHQRWRAVPGVGRTTLLRPRHAPSMALGSGGWRKGADPTAVHVWPAAGVSEVHPSMHLRVTKLDAFPRNSLDHPVSDQSLIVRIEWLADGATDARVLTGRVDSAAAVEAGASARLVDSIGDSPDSHLWVAVPVPPGPPAAVGWHQMTLLDAVHQGDEYDPSAVGPLALDVQYAGKHDGTRVQSYPRNCSRAQRWMLRRWAPSGDGSIGASKSEGESGTAAAGFTWTLAPACADGALLTGSTLAPVPGDADYATTGASSGTGDIGSWGSAGLSAYAPSAMHHGSAGSSQQHTASAQTNHPDYVVSAVESAREDPSRCTVFQPPRSTTPSTVFSNESTSVRQPASRQCWWVVYSERGDGSVQLLSKADPTGRLALCYETLKKQSGIVMLRHLSAGAIGGLPSAPPATATEHWGSALSLRPLLSAPIEVGAVYRLSCRTTPSFSIAFNGVDSHVVLRNTLNSDAGHEDLSATLSPAASRGGTLDSASSTVSEPTLAIAPGMTLSTLVSWRIGAVGQFFYFTSVAEPTVRLCYPSAALLRNDGLSGDAKLHPFAARPDDNSVGGSNYLWALLEETDGHVRIAPSIAPKWTLDVTNKRTVVNGTVPQLWTAHGGRNQEFMLSVAREFSTAMTSDGAASDVSASAAHRDLILWATYHPVPHDELAALHAHGFTVKVVDSTPAAWAQYEAHKHRVACVISSQLAKGVSQGYISGVEFCRRVQLDALRVQEQARLAGTTDVPPYPLVVLVTNAVSAAEGRRSANIVHTPSVSGVTTTTIAADVAHVLHQVTQRLDARWSSYDSCLTVVTDAADADGNGSTPQANAGRLADSHTSTAGNSRAAAGNGLDQRFDIGKRLGAGAFGVVYKVFDHQGGEFLAMKEIALDSDCTDAVADVRREVTLLASLAHPHVVQIRHAELLPTRARIFMEWMSGGSLHTIARATSRTFTAAAISRFMRHALAGLSYLHGQDIVHRDIKPGNLLLSGDVLKVADFGLAVTRKTSTAATTGGGLAGTPMYLSPEAVNGRSSFASDIWALGCTALELFTGRQPWAHLASEIDMSTAMPLLFRIGTAAAPAHAHDFGHAPPIPADAPAELQDFLKLCFRFDPAERPTAKQLESHTFLTST